MLRHVLIEWPAYLWDRFWFFYGWLIAIMAAVCIIATAATLILWALGLPTPWIGSPSLR